MKVFSIVMALAGVAMVAALIVHFGLDAVFRSLRSIGWTGFVAVCLIHLAVIVVEGIAWRLLVTGVSFWVFLLGRLVRDGGAEVLPFSQIGGSVLGARFVTLAGVRGTVAAASTMADITLEFVAKLVYMALGISLLIGLRPHASVALPIIIGVSTTALSAAGFLLLQSHGLGLFDRFVSLLGRGWAERMAAGAAALHSSLAEIYRRRRALWGGFGLHLACWIVSAVEVWLALHIADVPLDFATVVVIESVVYAIRTAAFAIPNAVGVQEGAYILIGASFGLTPEMALAISLLKRARDLVIGLPALAVWQGFEGGRLWRRIT